MFFNIISRGPHTPYVSREDTRSVVAEYRGRLALLMEGAGLDSLMSRIEGYMIDVLGSSPPGGASTDREVFETLSECLVRSGLAYESKLEDWDGGYTLTATDHTWGRGARPGVEGVLGELMRGLVEMRTGRRYCAEATQVHRKTIFRFSRG
jgi:hypothetical protein